MYVIMFRSRVTRIVNCVRGFSKQTQSDLENKVKQKEANMETLAGVTGGLFLGLMYLTGTAKR